MKTIEKRKPGLTAEKPNDPRIYPIQGCFTEGVAKWLRDESTRQGIRVGRLISNIVEAARKK